jgi:hypothetical protein
MEHDDHFIEDWDDVAGEDDIDENGWTLEDWALYEAENDWQDERDSQ